mmetsp:Transcript_29050/g.35411  ORF Transcript_29050/g.35411 Transcript_29050/m.35411 type:complete len:97 (+) Transcript_29050:57-347(+)
MVQLTSVLNISLNKQAKRLKDPRIVFISLQHTLLNEHCHLARRIFTAKKDNCTNAFWLLFLGQKNQYLNNCFGKHSKKLEHLFLTNFFESPWVALP